MTRTFFFLAALLIMSISLSSCKKDQSEPEPTTGKVRLHLIHLVDGEPLIRDIKTYTNAAKNEYIINELMYFVSDITFYKDDGTSVKIHQWKDIYYVDDDMPESTSILLFDPIPAGIYDSISFLFGISEEKNQPYLFINPPEVNMSWPEVLGGGYHYMMINGKWMDTNAQIQPFNFHLGIGQLYHGNGYDVDSIYAFVQNYFRVSLPGSNFSISKGDTVDLGIAMNIESWFETPHIYDHNQWGGDIMQKQPAMQMAKENGWDVFSVDHLVFPTRPLP
ncbi:MAG: hypothetical protein FJY10_07830 [Bacteroidetes bacterium]|nr:hypothetical protein [Bacteroidota bacterium]